MHSLEVVAFFETEAITDAGRAHFVKLPQLNRAELFGLPRGIPDGSLSGH